MRTWVKEFIVVAFILLGANFIFHSFSLTEIIGSLAVLATFGYTQISDRMLEKESVKLTPEISCYHWAICYFFSKELLWTIYFLLHRTYSALVGVIIFLLYPLWRRFYRIHYGQNTVN